MTSFPSGWGPALNLRLHNVAIQTGNFERSYHFYSKVLRLPVVREPFTFKEQRRLAWFDAGSILIELYSVKFTRDSSPYDPDGVGPDHLAFEVDDLDAMLEWLEVAGYKPIKPPFVPPSGDPTQPRVVFIAGPDGEELQFRERSS
jgi:glyoxylase I family protein